MAGPRSRCASSFQAWLTEAFPFLSFPFLARQGKAGKAGQGKAGCKRGCLSLPLSLSAQGDAFLASCARSQAESIDQSDHSLILSFVRFPFLSFARSLAVLRRSEARLRFAASKRPGAPRAQAASPLQQVLKQPAWSLSRVQRQKAASPARLTYFVSRRGIGHHKPGMRARLSRPQRIPLPPEPALPRRSSVRPPLSSGRREFFFDKNFASEAVQVFRSAALRRPPQAQSSVLPRPSWGAKIAAAAAAAYERFEVFG